MVEETLNEFSNFLRIIHQPVTFSNTDIVKQNCKIYKVDSNWLNIFINYDIVIFPFFTNDIGSNVLAAACRCLYDSFGRSYAGYLKINPNISFSKKNIENYFKQIVLHEIYHVLIFHPSIFNAFNMVSRGPDQNSNCSIISKTALKIARKHFNCKSLTGIPLEDQGGPGNICGHWESRYMLGDFMISKDYVDNIMSDITLALFNDSGIFRAQPYSGGLFKFGKNKGCKFFNKNCIENQKGIRKTSFPNEFCTDYGKEICSASRMSKGTCVLYNFLKEVEPTKYQYFDNKKQGGFNPANYCPVCIQNPTETDYYPTSCNFGTPTNYGEKMGDTSFCFMSSLLPSSSSSTPTPKPTCYKVECNTKKNNIIVHIGTSKVTCPKSGGTIKLSGFKGSIDCPKYTEICNSNKLCNNLLGCIKKKSKTKKSILDEDSYTYLDDEDNNENRNSSENEPGNEEDIINLIKRNSSINVKYNFYFIISFLVLYP